MESNTKGVEDEVLFDPEEVLQIEDPVFEQEIETTELQAADNELLIEINENLNDLNTYGIILVWFLFVVVAVFATHFVYKKIIMKIINQSLNFRI